jgi:hypothetical protein
VATIGAWPRAPDFRWNTPARPRLSGAVIDFHVLAEITETQKLRWFSDYGQASQNGRATGRAGALPPEVSRMNGTFQDVGWGVFLR